MLGSGHRGPIMADHKQGKQPPLPSLLTAWQLSGLTGLAGLATAQSIGGAAALGAAAFWW